jgi:hypothetical protein
MRMMVAVFCNEQSSFGQREQYHDRQHSNKINSDSNSSDNIKVEFITPSTQMSNCTMLWLVCVHDECNE